MKVSSLRRCKLGVSLWRSSTVDILSKYGSRERAVFAPHNMYRREGGREGGGGGGQRERSIHCMLIDSH